VLPRLCSRPGSRPSTPTSATNLPLSADRAPISIVEGISNYRFRIGGGTPGMRISWQVTGVRKDAWAAAHPLCVEQEKSAEERGYYLHPELYGATEEKSIGLLRDPRPPSPVPLERSSVTGDGP
jgi:hypothetical protein